MKCTGIAAKEKFILEQEFFKEEINTCGIAEMQWKNKDHFENTEYNIFISIRGQQD